MRTHDYELIDFEELRLEQEDKFKLSDSCKKRNKNHKKNILWESDNRDVVSVSQTGLVSAIGKGTATVTATLGEKKEHCRFTVIGKQFPFKDVKVGDWYYDAVDFMRSNQLMRGRSSKVFAPMETVSRAQFVTIVYRLAECPEISFSNVFSDVGIGEWYASAVIWAHDSKLVEPEADTKCFRPADHITREQMAVMMYRYAKYNQYQLDELADIKGFQDAAEVSREAGKAMSWAVGTGLLTGLGDSSRIPERKKEIFLMPQRPALRCECAAIIMRFVKKYQI